MPLLRGRAATPIRPGIATKSVLLGKTPLRTGELVTEAAITDLHSAYRALVEDENTRRPRYKRLRGMTYRSYITWFKFAQLLGLVELVREEPMLYPPAGKNLLSIRKPDGITVVTSVRRVFKLTDNGREDERSWLDLCKSWMEKWPIPQKVEVAPPTPPPPRPPRPPKVRVPPTEIPPFKWVEKPSTRQFKFLADYLVKLSSLGPEFPGVVKKLEELSMKLGDWAVHLEDSISITKEEEKLERYELWLEHIEMASDALDEHDVDRAVSHLRVITR